MGPERTSRASRGRPKPNSIGQQSRVKSFEIDERLVSGAWEKVRANKGGPGVDPASLAAFAEASSGNIYKLWNRMSSGSYFPGPVRAVEIPDDQGPGVRVLGVPNTVDRVAQMATASLLEEKLEPTFHPDAGAAPDDLEDNDWAIDLDVEDFFDRVPHDQLLKAVSAYVSERWVLLYIERWLQAPMQLPDGRLVGREEGTPQGSPISPLLANIYLHDGFDRWMDREHPTCPFERHADHIRIHCGSETQAREVLADIVERLGTLGLEPHPDPTRVVYCTAANTSGNPEDVSVRTRLARGLSGRLVDSVPAISIRAKQAISQKIRAGYLNRRSTPDPSGPAAGINRHVRDLIDQYGRINRPDLRINEYLTRWAKKGRKNR